MPSSEPGGRPLWGFYVFEGMKDGRALFRDAPCHRRQRQCSAHQHDLRRLADPRKVEPPTARKVAQEPRDIAANPDRFLYQQLWTQPFDASRCAEGLELPRSGKSDLGSILFDNAMLQIENAARYAASVAGDAEEASPRWSARSPTPNRAKASPT